MPQENRLGADRDGQDLGASFEQANSPIGSDLGPSFEEHNRSSLEHPRRKWFWILGIGLLLLVIFLIYHFSGDTTGKAAAGDAGAGGGKGHGQTGPATITIGQSTSGDINVYVKALGTVTPTNTITLYSQITGRVMEVHYREGQTVRKGDPLVDIDPRPSQATLTQAEGTLQHDQAVLDQAKMDLTRYQAALARNAIARQIVEDQEKLVLQYEGTVKTDEGTVEYDKVQLSYCHIVAPISGRVGLRLVDPGNTVFSGSSSTLVVITQLQPITVVFNVSEDDLPSVQDQLKGHKTLEVDAYDRADDKQLEAGKLSSLDNQIDTTTGTVKFRASFANKDFDLFPNQFVNASLLLTTLKNATLVPSGAVQHNGTAAFVYIVNANNTVSVQPVTTSTSNDTDTAVTGLNPGVNVATSGFDRLEAGVQVRTQAKGKKGAQGSDSATPGNSPTTASSSGNGSGTSSK